MGENRYDKQTDRCCRKTLSDSLKKKHRSKYVKRMSFEFCIHNEKSTKKNSWNLRKMWIFAFIWSIDKKKQLKLSRSKKMKIYWKWKDYRKSSALVCQFIWVKFGRLCRDNSTFVFLSTFISIINFHMNRNRSNMQVWHLICFSLSLFG